MTLRAAAPRPPEAIADHNDREPEDGSPQERQSANPDTTRSSWPFDETAAAERLAQCSLAS